MGHIRLIVLMAIVSTSNCAQSGHAETLKDDGERQRLSSSLAGACKDLTSEAQWLEADACRRAWFAEHEEAVWRLNLNPHRSKNEPRS